MTLNTFTAYTKAQASEVNSNFTSSYTIHGLNHIRQLIDRAGVYSNGMIDGWGEAYVDSNGINNSVGGTTDALYDSSNYKYTTDFSSTTTTQDLTPNNDRDSNYETYTVTGTANANMIITYFGIGGSTYFSSGNCSITVKVSDITIASLTISYPNLSGTLTTNDYSKFIPSGSTFTVTYTVPSGQALMYTQVETHNGSLATFTSQKLPTVFVGSTPTKIYTFTEIESNTTPNIIEHTIPSGQFSSTINSAIGVPFIEDWESGANIQYKLTNTTEDTGWLDAMNTSPEISSFTAFTSEPDTLIVRLVPKSTNPTLNHPSLKGFWVLAK